MRNVGTCLIVLLAIAACASTEPQATTAAANADVASGPGEPAVEISGIDDLETPDATPAAAQTAPEPKVVCRMEKSIGSRVGKRTCRTVAQEEAAREAAREDLQTTIDRSVGSDMSTIISE